MSAIAQVSVTYNFLNKNQQYHGYVTRCVTVRCQLSPTVNQNLDDHKFKDGRVLETFMKQ